MTSWLNRLEGHGGSIDVPDIGIHVGDIRQWTSKRRGDEGPDSGVHDLRAVLSFVNHPIWGDADWIKRVTVYLGRPGRGGRILEVQTSEATSSRIEGQVLTMEGVVLCQVER